MSASAIASRHVIEQGMRIAVMADAMALRRGPAGRFADGAVTFLPSRKNVARTHSFLRASRILRRGAGPGTIIEREHQFLGDAAAALKGIACGRPAVCSFGIDLEYPLGPERIRIAGA